MSKPILYHDWKSSASYRVRIALNLKGIDYISQRVNLAAGEHKSEVNMARNPQGQVPTLEIDGLILTQSVPIIEYLDETRPDIPLLPDDAHGRHRVRAIAAAIAMEIQPICNGAVARYAAALAGETDTGFWIRHWIAHGLTAVEEMVAAGRTGGFCHLDRPGLADCCLIPQMANARRWDVDLAPYPALREVEAHCNELNAFKRAHPDVAAAS